MPSIGIPELIIVLVILLVIFGPKRLPGLGRSLGSGMREFKDSISGDSRRRGGDDEDDDDHDAFGRRSLERTTTPESATVVRADEPERVPPQRS
jgi:sec-independent protein translocase protein TatA